MKDFIRLPYRTKNEHQLFRYTSGSEELQTTNVSLIFYGNRKILEVFLHQKLFVKEYVIAARNCRKHWGNETKC